MAFWSGPEIVKKKKKREKLRKKKEISPKSSVYEYQYITFFNKSDC